MNNKPEEEINDKQNHVEDEITEQKPLIDDSNVIKEETTDNLTEEQKIQTEKTEGEEDANKPQQEDSIITKFSLEQEDSVQNKIQETKTFVEEINNLIEHTNAHVAEIDSLCDKALNNEYDNCQPLAKKETISFEAMVANKNKIKGEKKHFVELEAKRLHNDKYLKDLDETLAKVNKSSVLHKHRDTIEEVLKTDNEWQELLMRVVYSKASKAGNQS